MMDVVQAQTFLAIVECGNFIEASKRVNVTQSTVSARIKSLEEQLGKALFYRSKGGCTLTPAGQQFYRFARSMVRVWEEAKHHVAVPEGYDDTIIIGGQYSLWNRLLVQWVPQFQAQMPNVAIKCEIGMPQRLIQEMSEGTMDLAVVYRPEQRPGMYVEQLLEDDLILVTTDLETPLRDNYIYNDWGEAFRTTHAATFPDLHNPGLTINLGAIGVNLVIRNKGASYFPKRIVQTHLDEGVLFQIQGAPTFSFPAYVVYQEAFSSPEIMDCALSTLRFIATQAVEGELPPPFWQNLLG
ncbi:LysR family transcriptional regulator [Hirschia baltica]|uniref:Transcriptional regulator, LysR family n=1 Tax=Hirschia baltica (strain ATCC 49814 / DSM 5838 / IFAM 1418) TaxID=582402 RepID=C6XRZ4_HIRBI|nr:LysR family transcriptional regulator [Hirschia baltica]ACT60835.1 transcriptional regulator, LysR family [Hirschia baltica ATCC 49814]